MKAVKNNVRGLSGTLVGMGAILCGGLASACDFSALADAVNQEDTAQSSDELSNEARGIWNVAGDNVTDNDLREALGDINGVVNRAGSLPVQVKIGDLSKGDLARVALSANDPTKASGVLTITEVACPLDTIARLVTARNQIDLYPGGADTFTRNYTTPIDTFVSGTAPSVGWHSVYASHGLGLSWSTSTVGLARRVSNPAPGVESALIVRIYQDQPATLLSGKNAEQNQLYRAAIYYQRNGTTLHIAVNWADVQYGSLNGSSQFIIASRLGSMIDEDIHTANICKSGNPSPSFE